MLHVECCHLCHPRACGWPSLRHWAKFVREHVTEYLKSWHREAFMYQTPYKQDSIPIVWTAVHSRVYCAILHKILVMGEIEPTDNFRAKCPTNMCRHFDAMKSDDMPLRKMPEILILKTNSIVLPFLGFSVVEALLSIESSYHDCARYRK